MRTPILMTALGWLVLAMPGAAQDEPVDPSADDDAPAPAEESADSTDDESIDAADEEEFIFSEEIPANTQLVFPVDI